MPAEPNHRLEQACVALKRANAQAWDDLMGALADERNRLVGEIVDVPRDELATMQGRLQVIAHLMTRMINAATILDTTDRNRNLAQQQRRAMAAGVEGGLPASVRPTGWA